MHLDIVRRTYTAPDSIFFDFCRVFFALKKKTKCLNERFAWIGSDSRSHALYWCITSVRDCKSLILLFFLLTFGPQVQRVCWHVALGKCRFLAKLHVDPFFVLVYILVFIRWYRTLAAYIQKFIYRHTRQYTSCRHFAFICILFVFLSASKESGCYIRKRWETSNSSFGKLSLVALCCFLPVSFPPHFTRRPGRRRIYLSPCKNFFF